MVRYWQPSPYIGRHETVKKRAWTGSADGFNEWPVSSFRLGHFQKKRITILSKHYIFFCTTTLGSFLVNQFLHFPDKMGPSDACHLGLLPLNPPLNDTDVHKIGASVHVFSQNHRDHRQITIKPWYRGKKCDRRLRARNIGQIPRRERVNVLSNINDIPDSHLGGCKCANKIHDNTPTYEISIYYFEFMDRGTVTYHHYQRTDISPRVQRNLYHIRIVRATETAL